MTRILLETHWLNEFSMQVQTKAFAVMLRHSGGLPSKPFVTKMAKKHPHMVSVRTSEKEAGDSGK